MTAQFNDALAAWKSSLAGRPWFEAYPAYLVGAGLSDLAITIELLERELPGLADDGDGALRRAEADGLKRAFSFLCRVHLGYPAREEFIDPSAGSDPIPVESEGPVFSNPHLLPDDDLDARLDHSNLTRLIAIRDDWAKLEPEERYRSGSSDQRERRLAARLGLTHDAIGRAGGEAASLAREAAHQVAGSMETVLEVRNARVESNVGEALARRFGSGLRQADMMSMGERFVSSLVRVRDADARTFRVPVVPSSQWGRGVHHWALMLPRSMGQDTMDVSSLVPDGTLEEEWRLVGLRESLREGAGSAAASERSRFLDDMVASASPQQRVVTLALRTYLDESARRLSVEWARLDELRSSGAADEVLVVQGLSALSSLANRWLDLARAGAEGVGMAPDVVGPGLLHDGVVGEHRAGDAGARSLDIEMLRTLRARAEQEPEVHQVLRHVEEVVGLIGKLDIQREGLRRKELEEGMSPDGLHLEVGLVREADLHTSEVRSIEERIGGSSSSPGDLEFGDPVDLLLDPADQVQGGWTSEDAALALEPGNKLARRLEEDDPFDAIPMLLNLAGKAVTDAQQVRAEEVVLDVLVRADVVNRRLSIVEDLFGSVGAAQIAIPGFDSVAALQHALAHVIVPGTSERMDEEVLAELTERRPPVSVVVEHWVRDHPEHLQDEGVAGALASIERAGEAWEQVRRSLAEGAHGGADEGALQRAGIVLSNAMVGFFGREETEALVPFLAPHISGVTDPGAPAGELAPMGSPEDLPLWVADVMDAIEEGCPAPGGRGPVSPAAGGAMDADRLVATCEEARIAVAHARRAELTAAVGSYIVDRCGLAGTEYDHPMLLGRIAVPAFCRSIAVDREAAVAIDPVLALWSAEGALRRDVANGRSWPAVERLSEGLRPGPPVVIDTERGPVPLLSPMGGEELRRRSVPLPDEVRSALAPDVATQMAQVAALIAVERERIEAEVEERPYDNRASAALGRLEQLERDREETTTRMVERSRSATLVSLDDVPTFVETLVLRHQEERRDSAVAAEGIDRLRSTPAFAVVAELNQPSNFLSDLPGVPTWQVASKYFRSSQQRPMGGIEVLLREAELLQVARERDALHDQAGRAMARVLDVTVSDDRDRRDIGAAFVIGVAEGGTVGDGRERAVQRAKQVLAPHHRPSEQQAAQGDEHVLSALREVVDRASEQPGAVRVFVEGASGRASRGRGSAAPERAERSEAGERDRGRRGEGPAGRGDGSSDDGPGDGPEGAPGGDGGSPRRPNGPGGTGPAPPAAAGSEGAPPRKELPGSAATERAVDAEGDGAAGRGSKTEKTRGARREGAPARPPSSLPPPPGAPKGPVQDRPGSSVAPPPPAVPGPGAMLPVRGSRTASPKPPPPAIAGKPSGVVPGRPQVEKPASLPGDRSSTDRSPGPRPSRRPDRGKGSGDQRGRGDGGSGRTT